MHSQYLRACYLNNEFAQGEFEVGGQKVDPGKVEIDTYVLSAVDDHIVPWESGYKTAHLLGGRNRFVLSTSGHIAGIVNPPGPKAKHWITRTASRTTHWSGKRARGFSRAPGGRTGPSGLPGRGARR